MDDMEHMIKLKTMNQHDRKLCSRIQFHDIIMIKSYKHFRKIYIDIKITIKTEFSKFFLSHQLNILWL